MTEKVEHLWGFTQRKSDAGVFWDKLAISLLNVSASLWSRVYLLPFIKTMKQNYIERFIFSS